VYPRFLNGNPVTGTEGSIPPATAFDEDQIEIVTVISNAGLTPDHNDLTQLWQAIQALIGQKYITSPIVKKVHGPGADFADLNVALDWLAKYIITPSGYVTFMVAAGRWTYTTNIEINHANMARVAIQGAALLGGAPSGSNMSVTGYFNSADGSAQIIYLRSIYATELSFTGGVTGFSVLRGGCVLRYLLITGSQTIGTPPPGGTSYYWGWGSGMEVYDTVFIDGCSWWGFGNQGWYVSAGTVTAETSLNIAISFCGGGTGGTISNGGGVEWVASWILLRCNEFIVTSCNGPGIIGTGGDFASFGKCWIAGNLHPGLGAITAENGSEISWNTGGTITMNSDYAVYLVGGVYIGQDMWYTSNGYGIIVQGPGTAYIGGSAVIGNGGGVVGLGNAYIDATGAGLQSASPPANTEGNYGAWIIN
jgi:hypothetical protein